MMRQTDSLIWIKQKHTNVERSPTHKWEVIKLSKSYLRFVSAQSRGPIFQFEQVSPVDLIHIVNELILQRDVQQSCFVFRSLLHAHFSLPHVHNDNVIYFHSEKPLFIFFFFALCPFHAQN